MSYGLTPYDKKSYKQSKKRRKQALIEADTGKIIPIEKNYKKWIIVFAVLILLSAVIIVFVLVYNSIDSNSNNKNKIDTADNSQLLMIVNQSNTLLSSYEPKLVNYNGTKINYVVENSLNNLINDAKKDGVTIKVLEGYVSYEDQQVRYDEQLSKYLDNPKYTKVRAIAAVQKEVPKAGESESQTGLLLKFNTDDKTVNSFLEKYCVKYGFVLRYPQDKTDSTQMNSNSSIYRYVGTENAEKMRSFNMCLEQFVAYNQNK